MPSPIADPVTRFSAEGQDKALVRQSYERAAAILTPGEQIEYIAVANRTLTHAPDCAVATNKRVILIRKKVLGKVEVDDCWWRDVSRAALEDARGGTNLKLSAIQGWHLMIESMPRSQASHLLDLAGRYSERLGAPSVSDSQPAAQVASAPQNAPAAGSARGASTGAVPVEVPSTAPLPVAGTLLSSLAASPPPTIVAQAVTLTGPTLSLPPVYAAHQQAPLGENAQNDSGSEAANEVPVPPQPVSAPVQFIPTPESVLQSILHSSSLEEGVPTRPMQWSAAAFQAPPVADVQPVTLSNNTSDTEPQMHILPPLTTLERIAVFTAPSGPLALELPGRRSGQLDSSPLSLSAPAPASDAPDTGGSGAVEKPVITDGLLRQAERISGPIADSVHAGTSSPPLDAMPLAEVDLQLPEVEQPDVYSLAHVEVEVPSPPQEAYPAEATVAPATVHHDQPVPAATDPASHGLMEALAGMAETEETPHFDYSLLETAMSSEPLPLPPVPQPHPVSEPLSSAQPPEEDGAEPVFSTSLPTAPMAFDDDPLPMPGSVSSGPLLAAAPEMSAQLEEVYRNLTSLATQRLEYEPGADSLELPTRINLAMHNTPPMQSLRSSRPLAGLGHDSTPNLSADPAAPRTGRSSGSRSSNSGRAGSKSNADDPIAKMKQLKAMLDAGLITEEDYAAKKADILSRI